jgi:hypothetical protein
VRRFLRGEAVEALPEGQWQQLVRRLARHRQAVAMAVLAFAVLCLASIAGLVWHNDRALKAQESRERRLEAFANEVALQGDRLQTQLLDLRSGLDALALVISHAAEFGTPSRDAIPWIERSTTARAPGDADAGVYGLVAGASRRDAEILARRVLDAHKKQEIVVELARRTLGEATARVGASDATVQALVAAYDVGLVYVYPAPANSQQLDDPRSASWFRDAADPATRWTALDVNPSHGGRELVVSQPFRSAAGRVRGGIGLILSLDHALTNLVRDGQIPGVRATLLLDRDGTMLAMHDASPVDGRGLGAGPSPALLDEVRRASGCTTAASFKRAFWARRPSPLSIAFTRSTGCWCRSFRNERSSTGRRRHRRSRAPQPHALPAETRRPRYLIRSHVSVLVTRVWFFTDRVNLLPSSDRLKYRT